MSEQSSIANKSAEQALAETRNLFEVLPQTEPGTVETDMVTPLEVNDDTGNEFTATHLKVSKIENESATPITSVWISGKATSGKHAAMFGLLIDHGSHVELKSTDIMTSSEAISELPPVTSYREASVEMADQYDDRVLFGTRFDIDVLRDGHDPYNPTGYSEAVEELAESKASVPGIAHMGKLLVDHARD